MENIEIQGMSRRKTRNHHSENHQTRDNNLTHDPNHMWPVTEAGHTPKVNIH